MQKRSQKKGQEREAVLEQLSRSQLLALVRQMIQAAPELAELLEHIEPLAVADAQPEPFQREEYRLKIVGIFETTDRMSWGSEARAAEPLFAIIRDAESYVQRQQVRAAAILYELIIHETLDNYDSFQWHADEGDLDEVVRACVIGLSKCLQQERRESTLREQIIQVLCDVYQFDANLGNDQLFMGMQVPALLVQYTTPAERAHAAVRVRKDFALDIDWWTDDVSRQFGAAEELLLALEADTLDDETLTRVCRETGISLYLIDRLLRNGDVNEALAEIQHVASYEILESANLLYAYGHGRAAERIVEERSKELPVEELLNWLQERYQARGDEARVLETAIRIFQNIPLRRTREQYQEVRQFAEALGRWKTVRAELLNWLQNSPQYKNLQIAIALDEQRAADALTLLQTHNAKAELNGPVRQVSPAIALEVAKAVADTEPAAAIAIYQKNIDRCIANRSRADYHLACQYLVTVRKLFQKLGENDSWLDYITDLQDQNRRLPALRDEMAKAGL